MAGVFVFGAFSTKVGQLIEKATDNSASPYNLVLYVEICDTIDGSDSGPKDAIAAFRKRFTSSTKNFHIISLTLTVLETCVKNCSLRFHIKVAQKAFLTDMLKVINSKNNPPITVTERVLGLIQYWANAFRGWPELSAVEEMYEQMKKSGTEFPPIFLDVLVPTETPQNRQMKLDLKDSVPGQLDVAKSQPVSTQSGSNFRELASSSVALQSKNEDLLSENRKLKNLLADKEFEIQSLSNTIQDKERTIREKERTIQDKDHIIQENNRTILEKNHSIQQKNFSIETLTSTIDKYKQYHDESWFQLSHTSTVTWNIERSIIKSIPQHQIGKGAWGEVYSAMFNGQPVAIKYVHKALLQIKGTLEMIKREISIMAHIQHPNLVRFIGAVLDEDVDSKRDVPIIVLELLDMNLRVAYSTETLEQAAMLSIFCDVAYALHYLHEQTDPIIHRDVSAPNVLLKRLPNRSFQAKVSDFGSANLLKQSVTGGAGAIIYTAPEMFPQEDITVDPPEQTVKVDVFSYGIVLLEVVCVEMPAIEKRSALLRSCKLKWKEIYDLIVQCTKRSAEERPTMREILYSLHGI